MWGDLIVVLICKIQRVSNTLLVSNRSKLWAPEAPPACLLEALPFRVQGNISVGSDMQLRDGETHPPSSLKSEWHLPPPWRSRGPNLQILSQALSETVDSMMKNDSRPAGRGRQRQAEADPAVPWDFCWPIPEPCVGKSRTCSIAWPLPCTANPGISRYKLWPLVPSNRLPRAK